MTDDASPVPFDQIGWPVDQYPVDQDELNHILTIYKGTPKAPGADISRKGYITPTEVSPAGGASLSPGSSTGLTVGAPSEGGTVPGTSVGQQAFGLNLVPVDHDPFALGAQTLAAAPGAGALPGSAPLPSMVSSPKAVSGSLGAAQNFGTLAPAQYATTSLGQPEPTVQAYQPSWRDRIASWMMGNDKATVEHSNFVKGLVGSTGLGTTGMSVSDFTPAAIPLWTNQADIDAHQGSYGQSALDLLNTGALPVGHLLGAGVAAAGHVLGPVAAAATHVLPAIFTAPADRIALDLAQRMATAGVDKTDIWNKTGLFQGADQKWRAEISDAASRITKQAAPEMPSRLDLAQKIFSDELGVPAVKFATGQYPAEDKEALELADQRIGSMREQAQTARMSTVLSHPDVYHAYPHLADYEVARENMYGLGGLHQPGRITYGGNFINMPGNKRSTLLHELQHAIQHYEGFATGANTFGLKPGTPAWSIYQERLNAIRDPLSHEEFSKQGNFEGLAPKKDYDKYIKGTKNISPMIDRAAQDYAVQEAYRRSAGEVEARNVQHRLNMTAAERKATPPWKTEDVPRHQQIVSKSNGPVMSTEILPRQLNDIGLYSHGAEAAQNLPQKTGTPEQFKAMLQKAGVKTAEFENSGYDAAFAGQGKVTRDQVAQHFQGAVPPVEQTQLGGDVQRQMEARDNASKRLMDQVEAFPESKVNGQFPDEVSRDISSGYLKPSDLPTGLQPAASELVRAHQIYMDAWRNKGDEPKFSKWQLPGGKNYREVLLKLVEQPKIPLVNFSVKPGFGGGFQVIDDLGNQHGILATPELAQAEAQRRTSNAIENGLTASNPNNFRSSHWSDPNVLAHLRMSDRTDPNGEKVLHLEELQSDWGQQGRQRGFDTPAERAKDLTTLPEGYKVVEHASNSRGDTFPCYQVLDAAGIPASGMDYNRESVINSVLNRLNEKARAERGLQGSPLPAAPYVTNTQQWTDLGLKRALKEAAEGGYDRLTWTPGEQQAERYDLSKKISRITLHDSAGSTKILKAVDRSNNEVLNQNVTNPEQELPGIIGKEATEKLLNQQEMRPQPLPTVFASGLNVKASPLDWTITTPDGRLMKVGNAIAKTEDDARQYAEKLFNERARAVNVNRVAVAPYRELSGLDLKVGGKGMEGYYDKIVPNRLKEITKKLDPEAKIEGYEIPSSGVMKKSNELPSGMTRSPNIPAQSLKITPKLRAAILKGLPAFSVAGAAGLSAYKLSPVAGNPFQQGAVQ